VTAARCWPWAGAGAAPAPRSAIYVCFANARTEEEKQAGRNQDGDPATRGRVTVYEPEDWPEPIRQYEARTPRCFAPVLVPIPV